MDQWESLADRKIREAIEAGEFDNLPDKGQPIRLDHDPDPSLWMAHHLLRVNGFAPPWIEEAKEIEQALARLRSDLVLCSRRDAALDENRARAAELNRRILNYNLKSPSPRFHKRPLDFEAEVRAANPKHAQHPD